MLFSNQRRGAMERRQTKEAVVREPFLKNGIQSTAKESFHVYNVAATDH